MSRSQDDTADTPEAEPLIPEVAEFPGTPASAVVDELSLRDERIQELEGRLYELEGRLRSVSAAYRQKQEEIESTKRRLEDRASFAEELRRGEVVASLFDPVENLHRSLEASRGQPAEEGLRIVYQQFMGALHALGLEEVPGAGARFDPAVHEAIATQPVQDADQDNVIQTVFAAGYRIGKRLIRPARVVIGSYSPPVAEA